MRSINFRLMIFFCSILFLALISMGVYSYRLSSKVVEEKASAAVLNSMEQIGKNLDVHMRLVKKYMDMVVYVPEVINLLKNNDFGRANIETP